MIPKNQYIECLLSTLIDYTCSNLANHLENVITIQPLTFYRTGSLLKRVVGIGQKSN